MRRDYSRDRIFVLSRRQHGCGTLDHANCDTRTKFRSLTNCKIRRKHCNQGVCSKVFVKRSLDLSDIFQFKVLFKGKENILRIFRCNFFLKWNFLLFTFFLMLFTCTKVESLKFQVLDFLNVLKKNYSIL